jgi:hypothetical protein
MLIAWIATKTKFPNCGEDFSFFPFYEPKVICS